MADYPQRSPRSSALRKPVVTPRILAKQRVLFFRRKTGDQCLERLHHPLVRHVPPPHRIVGAEHRALRSEGVDARHQVAAAVGGEPRNVIFTSGGTEANALALQPGLAGRGGAPLQRLIVSSIEHVSVLSGGQFSPRQIELAAVTSDGVIDLDKLHVAVAGQQPALVSVMLANNETGAIQPIGAEAR